jgi:hypothetical protein
MEKAKTLELLNDGEQTALLIYCPVNKTFDLFYLVCCATN